MFYDTKKKQPRISNKLFSLFCSNNRREGEGEEGKELSPNSLLTKTQKNIAVFHFEHLEMSELVYSV